MNEFRFGDDRVVAVTDPYPRKPHSKEPWRRGGIFGNPCGGGAVVCDESVNPVAGADDVAYYGGRLVAETVCPADARRIIACVNILSGVPTETLERALAEGLRFRRDIPEIALEGADVG